MTEKPPTDSQDNQEAPSTAPQSTTTCTYTYKHTEMLCHRQGEQCQHPPELDNPLCRWHQPREDKDFRELDLSDAPDAEKHLCEAHLPKAHLEGAMLPGVRLNGANLQQAQLVGANLQQAQLVGANLQQAQLYRVNLQEAQLYRVNLQKAELARANLQEAWLAEANLQGALLEKANLQEARLEEVNLQEARLDGAELQRTVFSWVDLRRANLAGARLVCTRLLRVDLREALLDGACLVYTDLCGTRLQGATLDGARVRFVVLTSARGMAQLQLCTLKAAKPPLQRLVAEQAVDRRTKRLVPRNPLDVAQDHRLLKLYFRQEGRQDLSSRHYLAEMRWMRKHYRQTRQWGKLLPSWVYGGLCGYGERLWLVGVWSLLSIVSCCLLLIAKDLHVGILAPHLWTDYALASAWAFAAGPASHLLAPSGASGLAIAVTEALIGKFLISLFVFTLGRKVER